MYAIVRTGGKQYKVQAGDLLKVELLDKDLGTVFDIPEVLFVGGEKTFVGQPLVSDAKVTVVVTKQAKGPKVIIFKKKRRQGYRRLRGHRQPFTEIFVKSITTPDGKTAASDKEAPVFDPAKKEARKQAAASGEKKAKKSAAKKTVKKAAPKKKAATKKTAAKKKTAKKKTAKKKTSK